MAHLTQEQRYIIETLKKAGYKNCKIADEVGVDKSTIGRELKRNCDGRNGIYRAGLAQQKASKRIKEKPKKTRFNNMVAAVITYLLEDEEFSPEQITGYCKKENIRMVSHERIYQFIWQDKKQGGLLHTHILGARDVDTEKEAV